MKGIVRLHLIDSRQMVDAPNSENENVALRIAGDRAGIEAATRRELSEPLSTRSEESARIKIALQPD